MRLLKTTYTKRSKTRKTTELYSGGITICPFIYSLLLNIFATILSSLPRTMHLEINRDRWVISAQTPTNIETEI